MRTSLCVGITYCSLYYSTVIRHVTSPGQNKNSIRIGPKAGQDSEQESEMDSDPRTKERKEYWRFLNIHGRSFDSNQEVLSHVQSRALSYNLRFLPVCGLVF